VSGACLLEDGQTCVKPTDCASNACTTFYVDADGDGHGAASGATRVCGTTAPPGYVTSNDDCCDVGAGAANIHPGQTAWFTSAATACSVGWDYNCDGNIEQEVTQLSSACTPNPVGMCPDYPQWYGATSIPGCGASGSENVCISPGGAGSSGNSFCASSQPATSTQGCH
jgi:hypothetical protein